MQKIKTIINRAINVDCVMKQQSPFTGLSYKSVQTEKDKLNEDEIRRIIELDIEQGAPMWHVRNYFLFSFYCAGIRIGDLMSLRWRNITDDGRLHYRMWKNRKYRDFILVEQAVDILRLYRRDDAKPNDYIFPILNNRKYSKYITYDEIDTMPVSYKEMLFEAIHNKTKTINKALKGIATLAEIDKRVTFHTARHTFANIAKKHGADNLVLRDIMAHSSLSTTERYMGSFDTGARDATLQNIFGGGEDKERRQLLDRLSQLSTEELLTLLQKK